MGSAVSPIELRCCTTACKRHSDEPSLGQLSENVPEVALDFSDTRQSPTVDRSPRDTLDARKELLAAIQLGDAMCVRELLWSRAAIDATNGKGLTPLHLAVTLGHLDVVEVLLQDGGRKLLRTKDQKGMTPLSLAMDKHRIAITKLLLTSSSADKEALKTGLFKAAVDGTVGHVLELLECRAVVDATNSRGSMPLHVASRQGHVKLCQLLLQMRAGCQAKAKGTNNRPITYAAKHGHMAVVRLLVNVGARVRSADREHLGEHLLLAAEAEDVTLAQDLLTYGASRSVKDKKGLTPFVIAAAKESDALCRLLNGWGVSAGEVTLTSEESLQLGAMLLQACNDGRLARATHMVTFSARIDSMDCFSETPLWKASSKGHVDIARLLLTKRAHMDHRSKNCNRTPLAIAIDHGHLEVANLLLNQGGLLPDPRTLTRSLCTAARLGEATRVCMLLYARADVHAVEHANKDVHNSAGLQWQGQDALAENAMASQKGGSQALAENEPWSKSTPLQCAADAGHAEVVKLLTEAGASVPARYKEGLQLVQGLLKAHA